MHDPSSWNRTDYVLRRTAWINTYTAALVAQVTKQMGSYDSVLPTPTVDQRWAAKKLADQAAHDYATHPFQE